MPYVRISLATPREGTRDRLLQLEDELLAFFARQDGFQAGYRLASHDTVGRVTIWESQTKADHVASAQHTLAVRAEILRLALENLLELSFEGTGTT